MMMQVLDLSGDSEYDRFLVKRLKLKGMLGLLQNYIHEPRWSGQEIRIEEMVVHMREGLRQLMR